MTTAIDEQEADLVEADEIEADEPVELAHDDEPEDEDEDEKNPAGEFSLVIVDESKPTVDGRYFVPNKVEWREPPIPLLFTTTNGNGHKGGEIGGAITKVWREDGKIMGMGHFESGERGQELRRLISEGVLTGVSADVGGATVELEAATETTKEMQKITEGKILGVTALPLQAYDDTRIAVTASAIPAAPPRAWFENPGLKKVTPISVTADGRVYGHIASWGTCHVGASRPGECLTPPRSPSNYAHFTIGEVVTAEGDAIPTGPMTLSTGHAGLTLNANATRAHYDDTGTAVADVRAGEDEFGIWVSGAMRSTVTEDRIREFRASAPSGDWRPIGGALELVGVLAVNVPGFPIPRTSARAEFANGEPLALVAAGAVPVTEFEIEDEEDCGCSGESESDLSEELSALEAQIEELAAKMLTEGEFRNYTIPNKKSTPKEITGSHGHQPHGTSILWPAMYEELRKKGMTKEKAARISNSAWNKKHKAPGNATSTRFSDDSTEEFHSKPGDHPNAKKAARAAADKWKDKDHPRGAEPGTTKYPNRERASKVFQDIKAKQDAERKAKKKHSADPNRTGKKWTTQLGAEGDTMELVAQVLEEFRNVHAKRQNRDGHGRFAEHGGLGGLANKYKGPNRGKKLSKSARSGADTGSSGYRSVAEKVAERDGSAREKAQWARKEKARPIGVAEIQKDKATRKAKLEAAKRRAAERSAPDQKVEAQKNIDALMEKAKSREVDRKKGVDRSAKGNSGRIPLQNDTPALAADRAKERDRKAKLEAEYEASDLEEAKAREARGDKPSWADAVRKKAADRSGSPKASPKPAALVYRSVAEKIQERDGSAREKAAWSRNAKTREVGKAALAKEKADKAARKAKMDAIRKRMAT